MERMAGMLVRSESAGDGKRGPVEESYQFEEEIHGLMMTGPSEAGSSFTALLELPANQAIELLHSPVKGDSPAAADAWKNPSVKHRKPYENSFGGSPTFPSDAALVERASRFSIFAAAGGGSWGGGCGGGAESTETSSIPSKSSASSHKPKNEPTDTESYPNSASPLISDPRVQNNHQKSAKRKEREKKVKGSTKKSKNFPNESSEDAEKLPYVHVRARRGEATDSHSLAERARRDKINARMRLLQELVPGCNKITGTALVLDEIINHVQYLQRQVELLAMRLAAVNPRSDFNLENLLATGSGSQMDSNFPSMVMPFMWPDFQVNGNRQQYQQLWHMDALHLPVWGRGEDNHNFVTPENSLLSYDDSANSVSLHSNRLKMEL